MALVSRATNNTASAINNILEARDYLGLLTIAGGAAGGVILTQRIANRVLPLVGLSPTPQTITEGIASAGVKGGIGAGFMYGATQTGGLGKVLLAFLSLGSLTSAGFDVISLFFDIPSLAQAKTGQNATKTGQNATIKQTRSRSASATVQSTATDGGHSAGGFGGNKSSANAF